jgi:uncharacterized membrane-anchored protein YitT (DUF2179 family)
MKKNVKEFFNVLVGSFFVALGLNMFLVPFQLSSGGIGTIGVILLYFFKIPLSITNLILNMVLFGFGFKFLKKDEIIKTVFGITILSIFLKLTTYISFVQEDIFLAVIMGGVFDGIGMGLILKANGSTGGIDFCALMVKKILPHISIANFIFIVNSILFIISGLIFKSYFVIFYSIIAMFVSSKVTDTVLNIGEHSKSIEIISNNAEKIEQIILNDFSRGVTEIYIRGAFYKEERKMLLCVVKPKEVAKIIRAVKSIDKNAFLIISDAYEVLGEGFKDL